LPYPVTAVLTCSGVYSKIGIFSFCAASSVTPLACATLIAVLAKKVVEYGLSVRDVEAQVKKLNRPEKEAPEKAADEVDYAAELERRLFTTFGRKVKVADKGSKKSITFYYDDNLDLEALLEQICGKDFIDQV